MNTNTGRFAFLRQLKEDGFTCLFGNPGSSEENLLDALQDDEFSTLRYYMAYHEGIVVAIADSYARATQRPAIVQLHSNAGLANGLGMMNHARRGYTPMVVFAGEAGLKYEALDGQMSADLVSIARPFVKSDHNGPCAWHVVDPGSVLRLLRRAIKAASTPPMGPVFLALPMDVLDEVNTEPILPTTYVRSVVIPDEGTIAEAARLLIAGSHPIILMGDGIAASGAQEELTRVAELLGAAVWGVNHSEVNMRASHPLFSGSTGHMFGQTSSGGGSLKITSVADAVLICGTTIMPEVFPALEGVFAKNASIVHFDLNAYEIAKNFPVTIGAIATPKPTLALLARELAATLNELQRAAAANRLQQAQYDKEVRQAQDREKDSSVREQVPLHASRFMAELAKCLPPDAVIFDEALTNSDALCRYLPQDRPGSYFQTRSGMLGTGLPGTVGLKVAYPDKPVFGFSGDGGSISTIQALSVAARYNIGAKFIVCNNRSYQILKDNLQVYRQEQQVLLSQPFPDAFDLHTPDLRFDLLAEAQGVAAIRVEQPEEISPALERALGTEKPFLIDLIVSAGV